MQSFRYSGIQVFRWARRRAVGPEHLNTDNLNTELKRIVEYRELIAVGQALLNTGIPNT